MGLLGSINPFSSGNGNNGNLSESARMQEEFKEEVHQVHDSLQELESIEERILNKLQNTKTDTETYRKGIAEIRSDLISEEGNLEDRESEMKTLIDRLNQMSGDQASITWNRENKELAESALNEVENIRQHLVTEIEETSDMVDRIDSNRNPKKAAEKLLNTLNQQINDDEDATIALEQVGTHWNSTYQ